MNLGTSDETIHCECGWYKSGFIFGWYRYQTKQNFFSNFEQLLFTYHGLRNNIMDIVYHTKTNCKDYSFILTHKIVNSLALYLNSLHWVSARNLGCQIHRKSILGAGCEQSRIVFCATYSMYLRIRCIIQFGYFFHANL